MNNNALCVIPARGGSKRIPRKNIKDFCGKPIMAYSIEAALESELFEEVMVSTDDLEIAGIAKKYGATVPFMRSEESSNDLATTTDVLIEVLKKYKEASRAFDTTCYLYPTAPFVSADILQKAYSLLEQEDADFVLPVVKFSYPPQRGYVIQGGVLKRKHPEFAKSRSQDLQPEYHDAGQFGMFRTSKFLKSVKNGVELDRAPLIMNESEVQDIDTLEDWKIAELKYQLMKEKR